tara:strand:+ start:1426 stop:1677 length:252 start_codon:yes stop_codon:yes gene_type:complete
MGNTSKTYTGPNGGKQKLSAKARAAKQARDRKAADNRKEEKATAQVFRRRIKNVDLRGKDVHHSSDGSMRLVSVKSNRGHHVT